jgi:hypothetical protein
VQHKDKAIPGFSAGGAVRICAIVPAGASPRTVRHLSQSCGGSPAVLAVSAAQGILPDVPVPTYFSGQSYQEHTVAQEPVPGAAAERGPVAAEGARACRRGARASFGLRAPEFAQPSLCLPVSDALIRTRATGWNACPRRTEADSLPLSEPARVRRPPRRGGTKATRRLDPPLRRSTATGSCFPSIPHSSNQDRNSNVQDP